MTTPEAAEVNIWIADLDLGAEAFDGLAPLLSDDERERAARFRFRRDAIRFVARRAVLRTILAQCLGAEANALNFAYGPQGKPELATPFDRNGLRFSVSHSESVGLFAVAAKRRVGVDVERLRPLRDLEAVARRVFSSREQQTLNQLPPAERLRGFFNCWTRKEAYIKAIGEGLSHPLEQFAVSLAPGLACRLEHVDGNISEAKCWTLEPLALDSNYVGAIAIEVLDADGLASVQFLKRPRAFEPSAELDGNQESTTVKRLSPC